MFDWIVTGLVSWKTTVTGVVGAIFMILSATGVIEVSQAERDSIIAAILVIVGWFAKDSNRSGK